MNCESIIEDLQAFLDNELQAERKREVENHLNDCHDCTKMIEDLSELSGLLMKCDVPSPQLPTGQQILDIARPQRSFWVILVQSITNLFNSLRTPAFAIVTLMLIVGVFVGYRVFFTNRNMETVSVDKQSAVKPASNTSSTEEVADVRKRPDDTIANLSVEPEARNAPMPATTAPSQPADAPLDKSQLNKSQDLDGRAGGFAGGVVGGVEGGIAGGTLKDNNISLPNESKPPAPPPPPPAADPEPAKNEKVAASTKEKAKDSSVSESVPQSVDQGVNVLERTEIATNKTLQKQPTTTIANAAPKPVPPKEPARADAKTDSLAEQSAANTGTSVMGKAGVSRPAISSSTSAGPQAQDSAKRLSKPLPLAKPGARQQNELVIKNATLMVEVADFDSAKNQIAALSSQAGDRTAPSITNQSDGTRIATFVIKVPASNFESMIGSIRNVGKVTEDSVQRKDVTQQYQELTAQLNSRSGEKQADEDDARSRENRDDKRAERKKSRGADDATELQNSRLAKQFQALQNEMRFSTITVKVKELKK